MTATQQLNRRLLTGDRPRCSDPIDHQLWTSEHQQDRDLAAKWCQGCQLLELCHDAAVEREETWGIWGSKDFSIRPGRPKRRTA
jgi:hypothetical protein